MVTLRQMEPQLQTAAEDYAIHWLEARNAKKPEARDSANKAMDDTLATVPPDDRSEVMMQAQRMIFLWKIPDRATKKGK